MMRSTVDAAVVVCSVPNTRWPVSAVSMAMAIVSRSRSSPTRMMSGSSRSAARSARLNESVCVPHLALVDQARLVRVHELDRVFDRDDVLVPVPVDVVHQRAQRRRLARAGRPGDQHQPLGQRAELQDVRRQVELLGRQDGRRDDAEHGAHALAVGKDVGAEPGEPLDLVARSRCRAGPRTRARLAGGMISCRSEVTAASSSTAASAARGWMSPSLRISGGMPTQTWRSEAPCAQSCPSN